KRANFGQGQPVHDRSHGMLADAEMQIAPAGSISFQIAGALECEACLGGRREVRRAADKPWVMRGNSVQHLAGGVSTGNALRVGSEDRQTCLPAFGRLAPLHTLKLI